MAERAYNLSQNYINSFYFALLYYIGNNNRESIRLLERCINLDNTRKCAYINLLLAYEIEHKTD